MIPADALCQARCGTAVEGRTIVGKLANQYKSFEKHVSFFNCAFAGAIDLTGCRFERGLEFVGCVFAGRFIMEGSVVVGDLHFRACDFAADANFSRMRVEGKLEVRAPRDKTGLAPRSDFLDAPFVTFLGNANFSQIRVAGEANFGSVQFHDEVDFYNAHVEGPAFFRRDFCKGGAFPNAIFPPACFMGGRIRFRAAYFGEELNFNSAQFMKGALAESEAALTLAAVDAKQAMKNYIRAATGRNFAEIAAWTRAEDDRRKADDRRRKSLERAKADFSYVKCRGAAFFCGWPPKEEPHAEDHGDPCEFQTRVTFEGAEFGASVQFHKTIFRRPVDFLDCRVAGSLDFLERVPEIIRLAGATYKRLNCDGPNGPYTGLKDLKKALRIFDGSGGRAFVSGAAQKGTFERSSWVQLEAALRRDGESELADEVYRDRMRQERDYAGLPWWKRSLYCVWEFFTGFGTQAWRLTVACLVILVISICYYASAGKFSLNWNSDKVPRIATSSPIQDETDKSLKDVKCICDDKRGAGGRLGFAAAVTAFQFSPVKLPIGDDCLPEGGWGEGFAVVDRVSGWLLVPLLVANIAGLLSRRAKAEYEAGGEE
jgi:hypothetical protein